MRYGRPPIDSSKRCKAVFTLTPRRIVIGSATNCTRYRPLIKRRDRRRVRAQPASHNLPTCTMKLFFGDHALCTGNSRIVHSFSTPLCEPMWTGRHETSALEHGGARWWQEDDHAGPGSAVCDTPGGAP